MSWTALRDVSDPRSPVRLPVLTGHADGVRSIVFTPDGGLVVSALSGHTDRVYSAAFAPDAAGLVTASEDRTARLWQVDVAAVEERHGAVPAWPCSPPAT